MDDFYQLYLRAGEAMDLHYNSCQRCFDGFHNGDLCDLGEKLFAAETSSWAEWRKEQRHGQDEMLCPLCKTRLCNYEIICKDCFEARQGSS